MLYHYDYFFSICCPTTNPNLFFFFKVGIFLVFLLANAAKIKSQQVQGDENSGGAETGHTLQPYLGKINLKKFISHLVILPFCCRFVVTLSTLCLHFVYTLSTIFLHSVYTLPSLCLHYIYMLSTLCLHFAYFHFVVSLLSLCQNRARSSIITR